MGTRTFVTPLNRNSTRPKADGQVDLPLVLTLIALCGFKLVLPVPVPMSNFFPGAAAALLAAGSFEEDGLVFLAGLAMFVASLAYFVLLALGGAAAFSGVWKHFFGG